MENDDDDDDDDGRWQRDATLRLFASSFCENNEFKKNGKKWRAVFREQDLRSLLEGGLRGKAKDGSINRINKLKQRFWSEKNW